jgi:hypothetical protein
MRFIQIVVRLNYGREGLWKMYDAGTFCLVITKGKFHGSLTILSTDAT